MDYETAFWLLVIWFIFFILFLLPYLVVRFDICLEGVIKMTCGVEFYSEVADNWRKRWDEEHNARKHLENENEQLRQEIDILKKTPCDVVDLSNIEKRGMYKLWAILSHVSSYYYFGYDDQLNTDCDVTSMTDVIDIHDLDSFLEGYKKWRDSNNLPDFS